MYNQYDFIYKTTIVINFILGTTYIYKELLGQGDEQKDLLSISHHDKNFLVLMLNLLGLATVFRPLLTATKEQVHAFVLYQFLVLVVAVFIAVGSTVFSQNK